jgi:hypothetical protein
MKRWLVPLIVLFALPAEGMFPLPNTKVPLKTDVRVRSSKKGTRQNEYSPYGVLTSVEKEKTQQAFLAIEVRNMSNRVLKDLKIVYQLYELQFESSTNKTVIFSRRVGRSKEKFVPVQKGELLIPELKPLENKVVESEALLSTYQSNQDMTKLLSQTSTSGSKFGGYIVEYFVGGKLAKRDASSRRLHEAYLGALEPKQPSPGMKMNVAR